MAIYEVTVCTCTYGKGAPLLPSRRTDIFQQNYFNLDQAYCQSYICQVGELIYFNKTILIFIKHTANQDLTPQEFSTLLFCSALEVLSDLG